MVWGGGQRGIKYCVNKKTKGVSDDDLHGGICCSMVICIITA